MLTNLINRIGRRREPARPLASIPPGQRAYAVGDVHGRLDLFLEIQRQIEHDDAASPRADTTVILLGDLVDRGPDSRGVLEAAREWQGRRKVRILMGNHEEMFVTAIEKEEILRHFLRHGGKETVISYGMSPDEYRAAHLPEVQAWMQANVPQADLDFIASFEDQIVLGDYLFVHAGILPDVPLEEQKSRDLRWIREPFLSHADPHGHVVVHGHSICETPEDRGNRIGIDTGAYDSGRLTAVRLEGTERSFLTAELAAVPA